MSEEQAALVRYHLGEAKETLEEARLLARESRWRGALNRVYYAMFYATLALLAVKQLASSRHSGVIALFHREFVRPGLFAREWARYLDIAFNLRNRSDYQILSPLMWYKLRNSLERLNLLSLKQSDSASSV